METFIFAGIALLIVLPVIYLLPLGLSRRGKGIMVIASLFISLLGLLTIVVTPLWQTVLIVLLLIGMVAYFLAKKPEMILVTAMESEPELPLQSQADSVLNSLNDTYSYIALSDKGMNDFGATQAENNDDDLLRKAMRQADDAKPNRLEGLDRDDVETHLPLIEADLAGFEKLEVADAAESFAGEISPEAEVSESNSYLAEMEEDLMIAGEDDSYENKKSADFELEEISFETSALKDSIASLEAESRYKTDDNLSDTIDELPELFFEDTIPEKDVKSIEDELPSGFDGDFWNSLLEDDELEVLKEKKDTVAVK